jgi:hypothetical protein
MSSYLWPAAGGSSAMSAPCLIATASSAPTGTLSGTFNNILFNTASVDTNGTYSTGAGTWEVPSDGVYFCRVYVRISHTSTSVNNIIALRIIRSGSDFAGSTNTQVIQATGITAGITISHDVLVSCTAGQTLRPQSYTEGGSPAYVSGSIYHGFMIFKVRD